MCLSRYASIGINQLGGTAVYTVSCMLELSKTDFPLERLLTGVCLEYFVVDPI